ncbi:MAG: hypothetical protein ACRECD_00845 [Burkholderiaceae bacterium]
MSLIRWFFRKTQLKSRLGADLQHSNRPVLSTRNSSARVALDHPDNAARHKSERTARRELLYGVIRESMVRAGVLSASYKFKVLSLDRRGRQFVVMVDLAREFGSDIDQQSMVETIIAQRAKARHDIEVTAVYWRMSMQVTVAAAPSRPAPLSAAAPAQTAPHKPRSYALLTGYEDTELPGPEVRTPGLSATQYGDL